jgi:hypothetical protein
MQLANVRKPAIEDAAFRDYHALVSDTLTPTPCECAVP